MEIKKFRVFFAIPFSKEYCELLNKKNHIEISQRKIRIIDIIRLIKFVRVNSIDIVHAHGKGAGLLGRILNIFVRNMFLKRFSPCFWMFFLRLGGEYFRVENGCKTKYIGACPDIFLILVDPVICASIEARMCMHMYI